MAVKKKLMRGFFRLLLILLVAVACTSFNAGTMAYADCTCSYSDDGKTMTISGSSTITSSDVQAGLQGHGNVVNVVIGDDVEVIGELAFGGCTGLKSVTLGNSVRHLSEQSFYGCSSLESITFPSSVKEMGTCFENCTSLKSITFESTTPYDLSLSAYAFYGLKDNQGVFYVPEGTKYQYDQVLTNADAKFADGMWTIQEYSTSAAGTASVFSNGAIVGVVVVVVVLVALCVFLVARRKKAGAGPESD